MNLQHKTFYNKGCNLHYWYRPGRLPQAFIFLHGAGCDHEMFAQQLSIFDEGCGLFLWDARGYGLSQLGPGTAFCFEDMVDDFFRLCEIHQISGAVLVGQSMGGNLAQEVLYRRPGLVSKLVLIDCTKNTGTLTASEKFLLKLTKPILYLYPWKTLIRQCADACGNTKEVKQYVRRCLLKMKKADFIAVMLSLTASLHQDEAYRFPKPVLLLCGADDKTGNIRKIAAAWAESEPNCTLQIVENAGHNANQDNPVATNRAIQEFLWPAAAP
ncbi:MAG: alpha/beta fold hydrolase [Oscillospiraceae bacterium]